MIENQDEVVQTLFVLTLKVNQVGWKFSVAGLLLWHGGVNLERHLIELWIKTGRALNRNRDETHVLINLFVVQSFMALPPIPSPYKNRIDHDSAASIIIGINPSALILVDS